MENFIPITMLNDFIFCPLSIYFHNLLMNFDDLIYKGSFQIQGNISHESIDNYQYSHRKDILTGINIFSENYGLYGKIDIYDKSLCELIERKKRIKNIYDGYVFQLYAQYFCLKEMGYDVKQMKLYSKDDNKSYYIDLPETNPEILSKFEQLIKDIREFDVFNFTQINKEKCRMCIYRHSCDRCLYDEQ